MKKFILSFMLVGLLSVPTFAIQFCVRISCLEVQRIELRKETITIDVSHKINEYLIKGYKLISMTPEIVQGSYASVTIAYYCVFDDGKE